MSILEIEIPDEQLIRVARAQGYGSIIGDNVTTLGAEAFLRGRIKQILLGNIKTKEIDEAIVLARRAASAKVNAEITIDVRKKP